MGKFLNEGFHLLHLPEPLTGRGQTSHSFADGLLHWFSFVTHSGKLNPDGSGSKTISAGKFDKAKRKSPRR
jgi:hypothetical protein